MADAQWRGYRISLCKDVGGGQWGGGGRTARTLMMRLTKVTTSGNLRMSTSKCFNSFRRAFSVTILLLSLTAPRLRRYPAGSSWGSGGRGRSTFGMGTGEKGVKGVPGVVLPPEVLFIVMLRGGGDLMLDVPECMLTFEVLIEGLPEAFGTFSLREKRPILVGWRGVSRLEWRGSRGSDRWGSAGGVQAARCAGREESMRSSRVVNSSG